MANAMETNVVGVSESLSDTVAVLSKTMNLLMQKQTSLVETLENFVGRVASHEDRLKRLEDSLIAHLECATWVKATMRFWPLIIGALLVLGHYSPLK